MNKARKGKRKKVINPGDITFQDVDGVKKLICREKERWAPRVTFEWHTNNPRLAAIRIGLRSMSCLAISSGAVGGGFADYIRKLSRRFISLVMHPKFVEYERSLSRVRRSRKEDKNPIDIALKDVEKGGSAIRRIKQ